MALSNDSFEIKDSGKRVAFDSGMVRDIADDKLRYDLAFDGPVMRALLRTIGPAPLVDAAMDWYDNGGVDRALKVIEELARLAPGGMEQVVSRLAEHLRKGAIKYAERNWMKANGEAEYKRFKMSFFRHFCQLIFGKLDEDHQSAVIFNINGAEYVQAKLQDGNAQEQVTEGAGC